MNERYPNNRDRSGGVLFETAPSGKVDCSRIPTDCLFLTPAEERKVRRAGKPEGDMIDRTERDPDKNLSIQLTDYDVNDWRAAQKDRHRRGLERVLQFIIERRTEILGSPQGIEITISGSASRTGTKEYNDILSCKRATCIAQFIRQHLPLSAGGSQALLNKISFDTAGEGFAKAKCIGKDCEVGEFRSVLISVHRPGVKPPPIPPVPPGWDKYRIRCCSFKSESLGEALIGDLVERGIAALPEPLKKVLQESDTAKKLIDKAVKELIKQLKNLLKRAPGALGKLAGALLKGLPFPVEFIRDTGVFQIVERDKPNPKDLILCYTGFGLRLKFPRSVPAVIPEQLKEALKDVLKKGLKIEGVAIDILFDVLSGKIPSVESTTPGPFTEFNVDRKISLKAFEGDAVAFKGPDLIGKVLVGFDSPRTFRHPDPVKRPKLSCTGCSASLVPVTVGAGKGIEIISPTKGQLDDGSCKCIEVASRFVPGPVRRPQVQAGLRPGVARRRPAALLRPRAAMAARSPLRRA